MGLKTGDHADEERPAKRRKQHGSSKRITGHTDMYKRKLEKEERIKSREEKLKRAYAKIKGEEVTSGPTVYERLAAQEQQAELEEDDISQNEPAALGMHPSRLANMNDADTHTPQELPPETHKSTFKRGKFDPLQKEYSYAQQVRQAREERSHAIAAAQEEREKRRAEHERVRRGLDRARRPDRKGQRRIGRESVFLPGMVERLYSRLDRAEKSRNSS